MDDSSQLREGERKNAAVLFADMTGSTAIAKKLDPEELDSLMTHLFSRFERVVNRYGGEVEKYIGDAMVAVFGARITHEDDAKRAVNAGLELLDEVKAAGRETRYSDLSLGFRIGIHSGLIATGKRGEFDVVTGDTMSLASRLESLAAPGTILVSEEVRTECGDEFAISAGTSLKIDGLNEPVLAYTVKGRRDEGLNFPGPFVGREGQCSEILSAYLKHDPALTNGYIIHGDAGIGKSRLAAELIARIRAFPGSDPPVLYVRTKVHRSTKYSAVRELLGNYLGIRREERFEEIRDKVLASLETDPEVADVFARYMVRETDDLPEGRLFVYLHLILSSIVKVEASEPFSPIVYVDNYQFIDQESLNFFRFFLQGAVVKPFFLFAGRPDTHAIMDVFPDIGHVHLEPLSNEVSSDLVNELWKDGCAPETRNGIVDNAAGVPLFIEEYVRYMKRHDDLQSLPPTVQNIFLSRVDGYEEGMRDLLKKLSVFRQDFSVEDATRVQKETRGDTAIVLPVLGFFTREGILRQEGRLYRFRHDAFKRTMYESLLNYNKRIIHRVIAKYLASSSDPSTPGILYHYSMAGEYDEIERLLLASPASWVDLSFLVYFDQLIEQRRSVMDLRYLLLLFHKAAVLLNNGRTEEAENSVREIVRIGISKRSTEYLAKAYHLMVGCYLRSNDLEKVRFFGSKALNNYRLANARETAIENVLFIMAAAELDAGNFDENQAVIDTMRPVKSESGGCARDIAVLHRLLAMGKYSKVIDTALTRLRGEVHTHSLDEPDLQGILSKTYWQACDFEQAGETAETAIASGRLPEDAASSFYAMMATAALISGDTEGYTRNMRQALYYFSRVQNEYDEVICGATIARALYLAKDFERFLEIVEQALSTGLRTGPMQPTFALLVMSAEYALDRGDTKAAEFYLREADSIEQRKVYVSNKDRVVYYYLWSTLTDGNESEALIDRAVHCLRDELDNLYDDSLRERLLSFRSFAALKSRISESA